MKLFVYSMREFDERVFFERFTQEYGVEYDSTGEAPTLGNAELAAGHEYVSIITTPIDDALMKRFAELGVKMITTRSVGVDHIDMKAAKKYGIKISHSAYDPVAVADYAVMLMLMANRHMKRILQRAEIQDYTLPGIQGVNISTQTIGVIGTGKIGQRVIRSLHGFGCRILAYDLYESEAVKEYAEYVSFERLLQESDMITLHMPLTEDNMHMIDRHAIALMKDGAKIINTARGGLIDTEALIEGIESGKLGGAGLDCIEEEFDLYYYDRRSVPLKNRGLAVLRAFPNCIVSPHMAWYTDRTVSDMVYCNVYSGVADARGEKNPYLMQDAD